MISDLLVVDTRVCHVQGFTFIFVGKASGTKIIFYTVNFITTLRLSEMHKF